MPANTEETIQLAFQAFDKGSKGFITKPELQEILNRAFGMDDVNVQHLFEEVDEDKDGKITYDEFKKFAQKKPEYCKLFMTYQEQKEASKLEEEKHGNADANRNEQVNQTKLKEE